MTNTQMEVGDSIPVGLPPSFLPSLSSIHSGFMIPNCPKWSNLGTFAHCPKSWWWGSSSSVINAGLSNVSDGTSPTANFSFANDFPCGVTLMSYTCTCPPPHAPVWLMLTFPVTVLSPCLTQGSAWLTWRLKEVRKAFFSTFQQLADLSVLQDLNEKVTGV